MHGGPVTFTIHWTTGPVESFWEFWGLFNRVAFFLTLDKKKLTCEVKVTTLSVRPSHNGIWIVALPFEVLPIGSHQLLNVLNNQVNCHCNSQETNTQQFNRAWEKTAIAPECTVNTCGEPFLKHHFQQIDRHVWDVYQVLLTQFACWVHKSALGLILLQSAHMKEQKLLISRKCVSGPYSVSEYTHARTKTAVLHECISGLHNKTALWASFCFKVNAWKNKDCGFALWASFCFKVNTGKNKTCYFKCPKPHSDSKYTHVSK